MFKKVRLLALVMCAVAMTMAMAAVAFAEEQTPCYLVEDATKTSDPITVKVVIESKQYSQTDSTVISGVYTVSLDSTAANDPDIPANYNTPGIANPYYTVLDAMVKLSNDSSNNITAYDYYGNAIDASDTYIFSMGLGSNPERIYQPALPFDDPDWALDGWTFRVNDEYPLLVDTTTIRRGAGINETPIVDNDIIHFYWDYPQHKTLNTYYSAYFVKADMTYSSGLLNIQLKKSRSWFENDDYWTIESFSNFTSAVSTYPVTVYDKNGNQTATGTVSGATGAGSISCTLSSNNSPYFVKVESTSYKSEEGYDEEYNEVTWNILDTTMAYDKISIN